MTNKKPVRIEKMKQTKIEKIKIKEPRPTEPKLLVNILELTDKVNEIIKELEKRKGVKKNG